MEPSPGLRKKSSSATPQKMRAIGHLHPETIQNITFSRPKQVYYAETFFEEMSVKKTRSKLGFTSKKGGEGGEGRTGEERWGHHVLKNRLDKRRYRCVR